MKLIKLLKFTSILEIAVGLVLIFTPSLAIHLLFGIDSTEIINTIGRLAGIVFLSLGTACWQGKINTDVKNIMPAVTGMFFYNFFVAIFFFSVRFNSGFDGVLLLPAAFLHSVISILFVIFYFKRDNKP